ncbi:MAG: 3-isopropylmalate dehydratase large subunit [Candidatus Korobacteraceae bacterium]
MGSTITEKILAHAAGVETVTPGEIITAKVDAVIGHDITTAAFRELEKMKVDKVFDRSKVYFTVDHFVPSPTLEAAAQLKDLGEYIKKYEIEHWFEQGRGGICHAIFPEAGLVRPGMVIVGSDSHTCTYGALAAFSSGLGATDVAAAMALGELWLKVPASLRFVFDGALQPMVTGKDLILHTIGQIGVDGALYKAMEFTGETIRTLPIDDRFTICNMAVEAGAKNGIIAADEITMQYLEGRMRGTYLTFSSDPDAAYEIEYRWDASAIEPLVAQPFLPSNVAPAREVKNVKVDQVVIGSCTNGRISDLRAAAQIIKGKKAARGVRVVVFPATQQIYLEAMKEGLLEIFVEAGAMISPPICGPCLGGHMGLLADGEVAIATTNRNFVGRMGHKNSKVYLASPYTAAASAVAGYIIDPRQVS